MGIMKKTNPSFSTKKIAKTIALMTSLSLVSAASILSAQEDEYLILEEGKMCQSALLH